MSLLVNILEHAALVGVGVALCYLLLWWRGRNLKRVRTLEAEALLSKARAEAEIIVRDARLAASSEAEKLRQEVEASFTARRAERAELEKRLAEREALINSQLERIVQSEKNLSELEAALTRRSEALESQHKALAESNRQALEQLQKLAGLSQNDAKAELLKRIEEQSLRDANNLTRQILDDAKLKA